ncbi:hypothetical protein CsSME_00018591 [Camellia sinensis var. sinensis]
MPIAWASAAKNFSKLDHSEVCRPTSGRLAKNEWPVVPLVAAGQFSSRTDILLPIVPTVSTGFLTEVLELEFQLLKVRNYGFVNQSVIHLQELNLLSLEPFHTL